MPLIMNGVTIPTNVANALNYNGTNITSVIFNGVTVWTQSLAILYNGWSGSSLATAWDGLSDGLETSGFNYRLRSYANWVSVYSSWGSVSNMAIFGSTTAAKETGWAWLEGSGNSFAIRNKWYAPSFITFNTSTKTFGPGNELTFVGQETAYGERTTMLKFETSGNSIRVQSIVDGTGPYYGAWISLT